MRRPEEFTFTGTQAVSSWVQDPQKAVPGGGSASHPAPSQRSCWAPLCPPVSPRPDQGGTQALRPGGLCLHLYRLRVEVCRAAWKPHVQRAAAPPGSWPALSQPTRAWGPSWAAAPGVHAGRAGVRHTHPGSGAASREPRASQELARCVRPVCGGRGGPPPGREKALLSPTGRTHVPTGLQLELGRRTPKRRFGPGRGALSLSACPPPFSGCVP